MRNQAIFTAAAQSIAEKYKKNGSQERIEFFFSAHLRLCGESSILQFFQFTYHTCGFTDAQCMRN